MFTRLVLRCFAAKPKSKKGTRDGADTGPLFASDLLPTRWNKAADAGVIARAIASDASVNGSVAQAIDASEHADAVEFKGIPHSQPRVRKSVRASAASKSGAAPSAVSEFFRSKTAAYGMSDTLAAEPEPQRQAAPLPIPAPSARVTAVPNSGVVAAAALQSSLEQAVSRPTAAGSSPRAVAKASTSSPPPEPRSLRFRSLLSALDDGDAAPVPVSAVGQSVIDAPVSTSPRRTLSSLQAFANGQDPPVLPTPALASVVNLHNALVVQKAATATAEAMDKAKAIADAIPVGPSAHVPGTSRFSMLDQELLKLVSADPSETVDDWLTALGCYQHSKVFASCGVRDMMDVCLLTEVRTQELCSLTCFQDVRVCACRVRACLCIFVCACHVCACVHESPNPELPHVCSRLNCSNVPL